MNQALSHRLRVLCGVTAVMCVAVIASAQEPLAKAKALYDAANYEEALSVLAPVHVPEAQQYKALCMLALGRPQEAAGAIEILITSQPTFEPSAEDVPPRFVALVSEAKKKLLPAIARKAFNEGREQFKSGVREEALKKFDLVTLTSSAGFKETSEADDLRTLASGFIELARATAARPEPKPTAPADQPVVAEAPVAAAPTSAPPPTTAASKAQAQPPANAGSSLTRAATPPARTVAPPPAPAKTPTPAPASAAATGASDVTQPVAVRQTIPPIPSGISGLGSPTASVRVQIGVDGRVLSAAMQQSSHPLYDRLVLQAAREWLYTPAMLNGRPVPSEKVVTIQLR
jgi:hypothetical protein